MSAVELDNISKAFRAVTVGQLSLTVPKGAVYGCLCLRQALPGGVSWWQPWLGLAGVTLYALIVIRAASRIFRIGILSQGRAPKLAELAQWVLRG